MIKVAATKARKEFFSLLDLAVGGETIIIERNGKSLHLVPKSTGRSSRKKANYREYIHGPVDQADEWKWGFTSAGKLKLKK